MAQLNRYQAEQAVKQTLLAYTTRLEGAEKIQDQLRPEAAILIKHGKLIKSTVNRYDFDEKFLEPLSLTGIQQFLTVCMHLAEHFDLPTLSLIKNADVIENPKVFKITPHTTGSDSAQSVAVEQGRTVTFTLDKTADYIRDGNMDLSVEWKRYKVTDKGTEDDSSWLNGIKNTFDDRQYDRDFSFPDIGTYKICADIYETAREGTLKHLWEHHDILLEVQEGDVLYKNMPLLNKIQLALELADWTDAVHSARDAAIAIAAASGVLGLIKFLQLDEIAAILAPLLEAWGFAGAIQDFVEGTYLLGDFFVRVNNAQSEAALYDAGQVFTEAAAKIGLNILFDLLGALAKNVKGLAADRIKTGKMTDFDAKNLEAIKKYEGKSLSEVRPELKKDYIIYENKKGTTVIRRKDTETQIALELNSQGKIVFNMDVGSSLTGTSGKRVSELVTLLEDSGYTGTPKQETIERMDMLRRYYTEKEMEAFMGRQHGKSVVKLNEQLETEIGKCVQNLSKALSGGGISDFRTAIRTELEKNGSKYNGMTIERMEELITMDYEDLSVDEINKLAPDIQVLRELRENTIQLTESTEMRKYIPIGDVSKYYNMDWKPSGFISRDADVKQLKTFDDVFNSMRLDYKENPFPDTGQMAYIKFTSGETKKLDIPYNTRYGGTTDIRQPFSGTGFTKALNGQLIPEYTLERNPKMKYTTAEIWIIDEKGKNFQIAEFDKEDQSFTLLKKEYEKWIQ